jgi:hypothetical protein
MSSDVHIPVRYVREVSLLNTALEMAPLQPVMRIIFWLFSRQVCKMDGGARGRMDGARTGGLRGGGCGPGGASFRARGARDQGSAIGVGLGTLVQSAAPDLVAERGE